MSKVEITPELLADLKTKAERVTNTQWSLVGGKAIGVEDTFGFAGGIPAPVALTEDARDAEYIAAANPQTMLALIEYIQKLEAAVVRKTVEENHDKS